MSFRSGTLSYARFRVFGDGPSAVDETLLDTLARHVVKHPKVGAPQELVAGWCGGRHVLDDEFPYDETGFGTALLAGMRVDVNRVPAELRRAYRAMAEQERAAGTETGFLGSAERKAAKEEAERRSAEELAAGRHRRSKLVPLVWSLPRGLLLAPASGERATSLLRDLLLRSLSMRLQPRSAGSIAWDLLSERGLAGDLDDALPSAFTAAPVERARRDGANDGAGRGAPPSRGRRGDSSGGERPDVPWVAAGPEPKDFLGNEFMLWLWWLTEVEEGLVETAAFGTVAITIDRMLEMDCAWGVTGRQSLRGDAPTRLPEAAKALQHGKWPRRCGLIVAAGGRTFTLSLQGDRFAVSGATLPEIDDARSVREIIEQRVERLFELDDLLVALFDAFLRTRIGSAWPTVRGAMSEWILRRAAGPTEAPPESTRAIREPRTPSSSVERRPIAAPVQVARTPAPPTRRPRASPPPER
ncbi:MAG: hypothetical protein U0575_01645 [Phycisphaerales bacterium]